MLEAAFWIISYCTTICNAHTVHFVSKHMVKPVIHHVIKPPARFVRRLL